MTEIETLKAEIQQLQRTCCDAQYMRDIYFQLLGPKAKELALRWEAKGIKRFHVFWTVGPPELSGEERAEILLSIDDSISRTVNMINIDQDVETTSYDNSF